MNIDHLFEQDIKLVDDLLLMLTREQISLINMDIDAVEQLLDEKALLLQKISASAQVRYKALSTLGFEASEAGMANWVKKYANTKVMQDWSGFQETVQQAKELNLLNGKLINQHFYRNQQFLHQLQGNPNSQGMYGANGQTTSRHFSRATIAV